MSLRRYWASKLGCSSWFNVVKKWHSHLYKSINELSEQRLSYNEKDPSTRGRFKPDFAALVAVSGIPMPNLFPEDSSGASVEAAPPVLALQPLQAAPRASVPPKPSEPSLVLQDSVQGKPSESSRVLQDFVTGASELLLVFQDSVQGKASELPLIPQDSVQGKRRPSEAWRPGALARPLKRARTV